MELFSIICETCQAKLRVRQPEAIGQILECPRCHSMVQVIPPPGWQAPSDAPEPAAGDDPADVATDGQPAADAFSPDVAQPYQLRTIWIALATGAGLLVIAAALTSAWLRSGGPGPAGRATAATDIGAPQPPTAPSAKSPSVVVSDDSTEPDPNPEPPAAASSARQTPEDAPPTATPLDPTSDSAPATPAVPPTEPVEVIGAKSTATNQPPPSAPSTGTTVHADTVASPPEDDTSTPAPQPDPVAKPPLEPPAARPKPPATATMHTNDRIDGVSHTIDVRARLADPVRQIDFDSISIADLIDLLAAMTRLPITLDLDALRRKGLDASVPVSVHLRETSVGEILTEALAQRGLSFTADDRQVVVTDSRIARAVVRYRVADLVRGDSPAQRSAGLEQLAKQIESLIAPATWQSKGGRGTIQVRNNLLEIDQARPVLYEILVFCEKLRLARGLPLQGRFPASRFPLASRTAQARDKLQRPLSITFLEPTPLPEVVRYVQHATGMTIAIDWRQLIPAGITPVAGITCGVTDKPLDEALSALLNPLGLDWRVVAANSIQVVAQAAAEGRLEVEFYPVGKTFRAADEPERLVDRMRGEVSADSWQGAGGRGVVLYDSASGHLIVLQTQPIQRQVEKWLRAHPTTRSVGRYLRDRHGSGIGS